MHSMYVSICTFQAHKAFFKERHRVISMVKYAEKPKFYSKPVCQDHPAEPVILACHKCYRLTCVSCTTKTCSEGISMFAESGRYLGAGDADCPPKLYRLWLINCQLLCDLCTPDNSCIVWLNHEINNCQIGNSGFLFRNGSSMKGGNSSYLFDNLIGLF